MLISLLRPPPAAPRPDLQPPPRHLSVSVEARRCHRPGRCGRALSSTVPQLYLPGIPSRLLVLSCRRQQGSWCWTGGARLASLQAIVVTRRRCRACRLPLPSPALPPPWAALGEFVPGGQPAAAPFPGWHAAVAFDSLVCWAAHRQLARGRGVDLSVSSSCRCACCGRPRSPQVRPGYWWPHASRSSLRQARDGCARWGCCS